VRSTRLAVVRQRQLRTGNDDDYDAIELLRRPSMKELSIERFIRRANARRKSIQREDFYRRLCLAWVNHFHGQLNKISVPPTGGPPQGVSDPSRAVTEAPEITNSWSPGAMR
jgi:hypothetical protein